LNTSFILETGSARTIYISYRIVAPSKKKSFHISLNSQRTITLKKNYAIVIRSLKHSMALQVAKYFAHLSRSIILQ